MSRMRLLTAAAIGTALFTAFLPPTANAATDTWPVNSAKPAADRVTVALLTTNGSGCPLGSIALAPTVSGQAFTLTFSKFGVVGGTNKFCSSVVRVTAPEGMTYAVLGVIAYGFAQLDWGATGRLSLLSRFTGFSWSFRDTMTLRGPYVDYWERPNYGDVQLWAPCNAPVDYNLTIDNTLSVVGPTTSSMEFHGQDVSIEYQMALRRC